MSLILDALSRAERDRRREAGPAPDLLADHGPVSRSSVPRRSGLLLAAIVILVLAGVTVWLLAGDGLGRRRAPGNAAQTERRDALPAVSPRGTSDAAPAALSSPASEVSPAAASRPPAKPQPVATPAGESISAAEVARLYDERDDDTARNGVEPAPGSGARPVAGAPSMPPAAKDAPVPVTPEPAAGERAAASDEQPVDLERALRRARAELAASRLTEHPAPLLQTLSKQFRDRVPTLMYLRHDYNPAGRSSVLINGATLQVGGRTRGVQVREILADSVVLRFEDQEFRLRALNSWVNL